MEKIIVGKKDIGKRIDKFLAEEFFLYSRGEIIRRIKAGNVAVNSKNTKPSYVLEENDEITLEDFFKETQILEPNEDIKLDVIFQNDDIIVINKQAGIQVHPSGHEKTNTLANAIIAGFPEVSEANDGTEEGKMRPGIVHRLDKDTSGVMVIAKNKKTFDELKALFSGRKVTKKYLAVALGKFENKAGVIDKPLAKSSTYQKQIVARGNTKTKTRTSVTEYEVKKEYENCSLVEVFPKTGRTHQIRVHLASLGHPILGDLVYGKSVENLQVGRQLLHAEKLEFELFGQKYSFSAPLPADFESFLASLDAKAVS